MMPVTSVWAYETVVRLVSFSILVQTLEQGMLWRTWFDEGPWSWRNVRNEFRVFGTFFQRILDVALSERGFMTVLLLQAMLAVVGCFVPDSLLLLPLTITAFLVCQRWRGAFNGGSDYMTLQVLFGLLICQISARLGLGYIAMQSLSSYFVAGLVKLKESEWRTGQALRTFLETTSGVPLWILGSIRRRPVAWAASWGVIVFEIAAPWMAFRSSWTVVVLASALFFHVLNAFVLGLNRFVWAWLATYPAVLFLVAEAGMH